MFRQIVPSCVISPQFLRMIEAPEMTKSLTFSIEAGGVLKCKAEYYTDLHDETAVREWDVRLQRTSLLYKLITGEGE